jgi:surface-anchored protein
VPDDPAFAFLGAPGDPVWVLPEIQDPELLWPGFGLEEVDSGIFVDDTVRVSLLAAYGPGDFSIFTVGTAGPTILADTGDGLPDSIDLPAGAHLHANWAFEGAGDYVFLVRASGRLASTGETVRSNFGLYHFKVLS